MATRLSQKRSNARPAQRGPVDDRVSMARDAAGARGPIRAVIIMLVVAAVLLVSALVGVLVLAGTPAFTITSIDTEATEHLSASNIAKLADVEEGTTLLTIDESLITENLRRNPWVGEVAYARVFPDRLRITVTERRVDCLVKMSTGSVCWCLGDDRVWIEPINLTVADGETAADVALALAQQMDAILVTDVPTSMTPEAGSSANDEVLSAISDYRMQFSEEFAAQIVCFSAASVESISCTLANGVEISLGAPSNIDTKEAVAKEILEQHPNQITYINVRVPSQPSYRKLGVTSVTKGTGVTTDLDQDALDDATAPTSTQDSSSGGADATAGAGAGGTTDGIGTTGGADATTGVVEDEIAAVSPDQAQPGDMILGDDGIYYTYEQYFGLE